MDVPPEPALFSDNETALKQIHPRNIQDNLDLTRRTAPTRPTHNNNIPEVIESLQLVNMDRHFPCLLPLCTDYSKDLQLKTLRDMPHEKVINKIVDQLNSKTIHFYNLPFALDTLRKVNANMPFSQILLCIWRTTTSPQMSNIKTLSLLKLSTICSSILYCFTLQLNRAKLWNTEWTLYTTWITWWHIWAVPLRSDDISSGSNKNIL